jgi:hypothetical protein
MDEESMYEDEDMDEEYDMDEESMYEEMDDDDDDSDEDDDDDSDEGRSFHVDESMLRAELRRLREAKGHPNAKKVAHNFGGGKATKHLVMQSKDSDLNVNEGDEESDEAEKVAEKALRVAKKATEAAKEERKARVEEARMNQALKTKLAEADHANATLREQLEEVNLFNAKLLYVNKLMQNRDLTPRQQRAIVESLDSAKSVREAKLLFTSLTESLKPKAGTVNEGRILGSSSRSTRSASPQGNLNESVEVDRWAILAGIKSDK